MIYAYSSSKEKIEAIKAASEKIGHKFGAISQGQLNDSVAKITMGMNVPCKSPKAPPLYVLPEVLLFAGMKDGELDKFLVIYKATGLSPVRLKAMVTPYNMNWSLYALVEELQKEARSFGE